MVTVHTRVPSVYGLSWASVGMGFSRRRWSAAWQRRGVEAWFSLEVSRARAALGFAGAPEGARLMRAGIAVARAWMVVPRGQGVNAQRARGALLRSGGEHGDARAPEAAPARPPSSRSRDPADDGAGGPGSIVSVTYDLSPRIDQQWSARRCAGPPSCSPPWAAARTRTALCSPPRACAQQDVPMRRARALGERGGHDDEREITQRAIELGEAHVVADGQAYPSERRARAPAARLPAADGARFVVVLARRA
jgi:hypothetical protein